MVKKEKGEEKKREVSGGEKETNISLYPDRSDNESLNFLLVEEKYLNPCTGRLPDATFPSDHLSIKANFAFVPSP